MSPVAPLQEMYMGVIDVERIFSLVLKRESGLSIALSGGLKREKDGSLEKNRGFPRLQC